MLDNMDDNKKDALNIINDHDDTLNLKENEEFSHKHDEDYEDY